MRIFMTLLAVAALTGCAAKPMYQWGGYESMLYQGYKDPVRMEAMKVSLQSHIAGLERSSAKVAPGLYAELGTLYLQSGDADQAVAMYTRERETWPESEQLMTAMITNLARRKQAPKEAAK